MLDPVQNAEIMGILSQVENTGMLTDSYKIVKTYMKMKLQNIPGKEVIQICCRRKRERGWIGVVVICTQWTDIHNKEHQTEKYQGWEICMGEMLSAGMC